MAFQRKDFSVADYLNEHLGENSTLLAQLKIQLAERQRAHKALLSSLPLESLHEWIESLKTGIGRLRVRALQLARILDESSAQMNSLVEPIAKLDREKTALVQSITAMQRFEMLLRCLHQIEADLLRERRYREMAPLLLNTLQLAEKFRLPASGLVKESPIPFGMASEVIERLDRLTSSILPKQLLDEFERHLGPRGIPKGSPIFLAEACLVIDVLGPDVRRRLIGWYCDRQLYDYKSVFRSDTSPSLWTGGGGEEASLLWWNSLEGIPKRFAWLKRLLGAYDRDQFQGNLPFPTSWLVKEAICSHFCQMTSRDISGILAVQNPPSTGHSRVDLDVLLAAIRETQAFENYLQALCQNERNLVRIDQANLPPPAELKMSDCFEPHLYRFVEAEESTIQSFLYQIGQARHDAFKHLDSSNRVLNSAVKLFLLFREQIVEIGGLSKRKPLIDMAAIFSQSIVAYARILQDWLPSEEPSRNGSSAAVSKRKFSIPSVFGVKNSLHSNDFGDAILTSVLIIINTADYGIRTASQLQDHLREQVDERSIEAISFSPAHQALLVTISMGEQWLIHYFEGLLTPVWKEMGKSEIPLGGGDHSKYTGMLGKRLGSVFPVISRMLVNREVEANISERLVKLIYRSFQESLAALRPIREIAAEQLLIDLQEIRATLSSILPSSTSSLVREMHGQVESQIKCLLFPLQPPQQYVEKYLMLRPGDLSVAQFRRILELRLAVKSAATLDQSSQPRDPGEGDEKMLMVRLIDEFVKVIPEPPSSSERNSEQVARPSKFRLNEQLRRLVLTTQRTSMPK